MTEYGYDEAGRQVWVRSSDPSETTGTPTTPAYVTTQLAFDDAGRLCRVVANATGSTNLQALTNPCADPTQTPGTTTTNVSTRYTYDGAGNLASMIDANGNTTTYGYDAEGRQTSLTDPLERTATTAYDEIGRQTSATDRRGQTATWTYDKASRITQRVAGGVTTTYTYDEDGNRLTALSGGVTITTTYDRLNRPKTVTISNDAGATTTYTYSLTAPSWTDPTGTYLVTLDKFDRQATLDDPVTTGTWGFAYRADGLPASLTPPSGWGNATTSSYDAAGHLTGLATTNATFTYTLNRAGNRLTEAATVTGDPQNGTATFTFDPLGRLTGYALPGIRTLGATWQADTNRASLTTDGTPVSTTFDAADRPTSTGFATDLDGRLTAIPARGGAAAKSLAYDALGRLVSATVGGVTRTYAYDPLDRLVTVSQGGSAVVRFRYVGVTASVAQLLDGTWAVTRNIGTDWTGTPLADWAAGGSGWRRYLTNGHGDLVAALAANGTVSTSLRLDPWGVPLRAVPAGYPSFGFQGSWTDRTSTLVYARARWYDPVLATFTSEDPLAGYVADPPSRHLYAYGAGDPVDRTDPGGLFWYKVKSGENLVDISSKYYGTVLMADGLRKANGIPGPGWAVAAGRCIWVPKVAAPDQCVPPRSTRLPYSSSLINYRWTFGARFTPKVQFNVGPAGVVFVRTWGEYTLTVGQGSPKKPSVTASTTGLTIDNGISRFRISPAGPVVMAGGTPIRVPGSSTSFGYGDRLPGSKSVRESWSAVGGMGGFGFCPEPCYHYQQRWSREIRTDGVWYGTPMYVKAEVQWHMTCGYEWWFYPAVAVGVSAIAFAGYTVAGLAAAAAPRLILQPR